MKHEQISETMIKITLTAEEAASLPPLNSREQLRSYIRSITDDIRRKGTLTLPEGRLLAEIYTVCDGSCVIFVSAKPLLKLFACDVNGVSRLIGLIEAMSEYRVKCSLYCGSNPQHYRLILSDPPPSLRAVCGEYGDICEISKLFAAQTAEYLTPIAQGQCPDELWKTLS